MYYTHTHSLTHARTNIQTGSSKRVNNLSKAQMEQLWNALNDNKFDFFSPINSEVGFSLSLSLSLVLSLAVSRLLLSSLALSRPLPPSLY